VRIIARGFKTVKVKTGVEDREQYHEEDGTNIGHGRSPI
jgi:hypothetical protein